MSLSTRIFSWRKYPICLIGYSIRRWEQVTVNGTAISVDLPVLENKLIINASQPNFGPTHLQYKSKYGFLLTWPLCLHIWYQFKPQDEDRYGRRIAGTERVFYWRFGARWEAETGCYVFPSWYGPGLRWD